MDWMIIARATSTLTFLILVLFGPITYVQLRKFIKAYRISHQELELRVKKLEEGIKSLDR